jgi:hypothetical protein
MKIIKSYSKVWSMEGILYAINDFKLPFSATYSQIGWFVAGLVFMLLVSDIPPFSFISSGLIRYGAIPVGLTLIMNKLEFEGKKPWYFFLSYLAYMLRPKKTYAGRAIKSKKKHRVNEEITVVRSEF